MSKAYIISGAYGVGKSEFVVQFALRNAPSTIGDLDVLNPFFRPREIQDWLKTQSVSVVSSHLNRGLNQDTPALSMAYQKAILQNEVLILDCAGSENGLKPLASLSNELDKAEFYVVVNLNRPESSLDKLDQLILNYEALTQRSITGFIHNTHLLDETDADSIVSAQSKLEAYSKAKRIPIVMTMISKHLLNSCARFIHNPILVFDTLYLRQSWMKGETL